MRNIVSIIIVVIILALTGQGLADVILIDEFNDGEVVIEDVMPTYPDFDEIYNEQETLTGVKGGVRGWGVTKAYKDSGTDLTVSVYLNDDEYTYGLWEVMHSGNPEAGSTIYVQYGGLCGGGVHWHEDWNGYDRFRFYVEDISNPSPDGLCYVLKVMVGPDDDERYYMIDGDYVPATIGWHEIMFADMDDGEGNKLIDDLDDVDGLKFAIDAGMMYDNQRVVVGRLEVIPEPTTIALLGLGTLYCFAGKDKRKTKDKSI